ncbi:MAG: PD-(D/E)XK nuclease family protein [Candidatus Pacearchaeota archaeon]
MAEYSHSKISTFEQCPKKYKFQYIDKIEPDIETTIEAFMGDLVHRTLEKLYKDRYFQKENTKKDLIDFYNKLWKEEFSKEIIIVKKDFNEENYRKMGEKFISDYYDRFYPFDQLTIIGIETKDKMLLPDGNRWHVRIDKLACDKEGNYYVCDYKTNSKMKLQEEADSDRQLAMYSIWVRDKFKDAKSVKLVWHMLAFNKDVFSERTEKQLKKLQEEVMSIIKRIEKEKEFPTNPSPLCEYCGYRNICPSFKHMVELEAKEETKGFKEDEGVKIVNKLAEIKIKKAELEEEEEKLKSELIDFAKQKGIDVVYGSNSKASLKNYKKVVLPEKKEEIISLLKKKNLWEEFSTLNYSKFNSAAIKHELDDEIIKKISFEDDWRIFLSKRKDRED